MLLLHVSSSLLKLKLLLLADVKLAEGLHFILTCVGAGVENLGLLGEVCGSKDGSIGHVMVLKGVVVVSKLIGPFCLISVDFVHFRQSSWLEDFELSMSS